MKFIVSAFLLFSVLIVFSLKAVADDVTVDSSGNMTVGTSATDGNFEVIGSSGEDGIVGSTSGTGAAGVFGENTTSGNSGLLGDDNYGVYGSSASGYAGYFQGKAVVTGTLTVGSLLGYTENDPQVGTLTNGRWCTSNGTSINCTSTSPLTSETDPVFGASSASGITSGQITNWDAAFGWGNHGGAGYDTTNDSWTGTGNISMTTGNVGIGTTSPSANLHIIDSSGYTGSYATGTDLLIDSGASQRYITMRGPIFGQTGILFSNSTSLTDGGIRYWPSTTAGADRLELLSGANVGLNVMGDGDIGIGTSSPTEKLQVRGSMLVEETGGQDVLYVSGTAVSLGGTTAGGVNDVDFQVWDPTINDQALSFNAGIAALYIGSGSTTTAGDDGDLTILNSDGRASFQVDGYGSTVNLGYGSVTTTGNDGDMYIKSNTGSTTISLDGQAGRVTAKILTITGGADLSEQFEINRIGSDDLLPGMVVSIDPASAGELIVSNESYDRKVAGIISGAGGINPGMMMGQDGSIADGSNPVALTGRVYCMVDASNGPIAPGDLLTTSDTPGHAMKVTDYQKAQGAIIGKAMTSLKEDKGLVLVLVTLQ